MAKSSTSLLILCALAFSAVVSIEDNYDFQMDNYYEGDYDYDRRDNRKVKSKTADVKTSMKNTPDAKAMGAPSRMNMPNIDMFEAPNKNNRPQIRNFDEADDNKPTFNRMFDGVKLPQMDNVKRTIANFPVIEEMKTSMPNRPQMDEIETSSPVLPKIVDMKTSVPVAPKIAEMKTSVPRRPKMDEVETAVPRRPKMDDVDAVRSSMPVIPKMPFAESRRPKIDNDSDEEVAAVQIPRAQPTNAVIKPLIRNSDKKDVEVVADKQVDVKAKTDAKAKPAMSVDREAEWKRDIAELSKLFMNVQNSKRDADQVEVGKAM